MKRCTQCVIPDTRPDTHFERGVCSACRAYTSRPSIDWSARKQQLLALLDRHNGKCIVPSSGGKDSTAQVLMLKELGAEPTVVTATTCHLTDIGRKNIDNLARYAETIEVTPNRDQRAELNRLGLEMVGDISWPEHVAIFTIPFKVAIKTGINLMFYGENPQNQYGGPPGTEEAMTMTRRWVAEFGGFNGLRPSDLRYQLKNTNLDIYEPPADIGNVEAHFLGQYIPWDSHSNAAIALAAGMMAMKPSPANWWEWENLDNAQTGIHDHMMYRKFGFGRGAAQIAVDVRTGRTTRDHAMDWVRANDGKFPERYMGVTYQAVLARIGMTRRQFEDILDQYTNWDLFHRPMPGADWRPTLKNDE